MLRPALLASFVCFAIHCSFGSSHAARTETTSQTEKIRIDDQTMATIQSPWEFVQVDTNASFRGLDVYNDLEIWASGTGGTVLHSYDGGESWRVRKVEGAESLDFRDIEALDEGTAVVMSAGSPAKFYRTTNGGSSWKLCFENAHPRVFFNAISFWDQREGIAMSDPVGGRIVLLQTRDGGASWRPLPVANLPAVMPGEAAFAGSGTNMTTIGKNGLAIALANGRGSSEPGIATTQTSRVLFSPDRGKTWTSGKTPVQTHKTAGVFSTCFVNPKVGCVVGGNYKQPDRSGQNYAVTRDGGKTWSVPVPIKPPSGYRSCVASKKHGKEVYLIAVGPNGTDLSSDVGAKWRRISNHGFHVVKFSPSGQTGWATGSEGRLARWAGSRKARK